MNEQLAPELVRTILEYDAEAGTFIWRARSPSLFEDGKVGSGKKARMWNSRNARTPAFTAVGSHGYLVGRIFGRSYLAHRIAFTHHYGRWPLDQIDHIDGDRANNAITNLRECNAYGNAQNVRSAKGSSSAFLGVRKTASGTYQARLRGRNLGTFTDEDRAARAYDAAAMDTYGEFASLNFSQETATQ